ncbi:MAG: helix-turn-helix domain-containing protein [Undibacterium sp.]|nr:helix-turn-helix domain-containing protein [Opitutaceae bacterium]
MVRILRNWIPPFFKTAHCFCIIMDARSEKLTQEEIYALEAARGPRTSTTGGKWSGRYSRYSCILRYSQEWVTQKELAMTYGVSKRTVAGWIAAYRTGKIEALRPRGRQGGRSPSLDFSVQEVLLAKIRERVLCKPALIHSWLEAHMGKKLKTTTVRYWIKKFTEKLRAAPGARG